MSKSKNQIANDIYGVDFLDLPAGKKAKVTREYLAQDDDEEEVIETIIVKIGRIGNGPTKEFIMQEGNTVQDLVDKSAYNVSDKESIVEQSSGLSVDLEDELENGAIYVLSPVVKSA